MDSRERNMTLHHHWILHNSIQDTVELERHILHPQFDESILVGLSSVLYFCPICGDVWARSMWDATPDERVRIQWLAHDRPCELHGSGLLFSDDQRLLAFRHHQEYPPRLLEWEALHLKESKQ